MIILVWGRKDDKENFIWKVDIHSHVYAVRTISIFKCSLAKNKPKKPPKLTKKMGLKPVLRSQM